MSVVDLTEREDATKKKEKRKERTGSESAGEKENPPKSRKTKENSSPLSGCPDIFFERRINPKCESYKGRRLSSSCVPRKKLSDRLNDASDRLNRFFEIEEDDGGEYTQNEESSKLEEEEEKVFSSSLDSEDKDIEEERKKTEQEDSEKQDGLSFFYILTGLIDRGQISGRGIGEDSDEKNEEYEKSEGEEKEKFCLCEEDSESESEREDGEKKRRISKETAKKVESEMLKMVTSSPDDYTAFCATAKSRTGEVGFCWDPFEDARWLLDYVYGSYQMTGMEFKMSYDSNAKNEIPEEEANAFCEKVFEVLDHLYGSPMYGANKVPFAWARLIVCFEYERYYCAPETKANREERYDLFPFFDLAGRAEKSNPEFWKARSNSNSNSRVHEWIKSLRKWIDVSSFHREDCFKYHKPYVFVDGR